MSRVESLAISFGCAAPNPIADQEQLLQNLLNRFGCPGHWRVVGEVGRDTGQRFLAGSDPPRGIAVRLADPSLVRRPVRRRCSSRIRNAYRYCRSSKAVGRRRGFVSRGSAIAGTDPVGGCQNLLTSRRNSNRTWRNRRRHWFPTRSLNWISAAVIRQASWIPCGNRQCWQPTSPEQANGLVAKLAVELCRQLRDDGHVAGTPDATEIVRLARDLSRLRGQPAPGRGELLEAIETFVGSGRFAGQRPRGGRRGPNGAGWKTTWTPASGTPRCGLAVQIETSIERLKLPGT